MKRAGLSAIHVENLNDLYRSFCQLLRRRSRRRGKPCHLGDGYCIGGFGMTDTSPARIAAVDAMIEAVAAGVV